MAVPMKASYDAARVRMALPSREPNVRNAETRITNVVISDDHLDAFARVDDLLLRGCLSTGSRHIGAVSVCDTMAVSFAGYGMQVRGWGRGVATAGTHRHTRRVPS